MTGVTVSAVGEKNIIENYLRPLFNPENDINGVGDDCATISFPNGSVGLFSTDRVPADLISYRAGLLDEFGLGRYLATLNLSDIAACGGVPLALLLNIGVPADFLMSSLLALSKGVASLSSQYSVRVVGGDMSLSSKLSISATAIGQVELDSVLRRGGAQSGDSIFVTREIGLTPVALKYCIGSSLFDTFSPTEIACLRAQFTDLLPMITLGRRLVASSFCTSCMDNTDGLWQTLSELSRESKAAFVVDRNFVKLPPLVEKYADLAGCDVIQLAFSAGADFSLVGTLRGTWSTADACRALDANIDIVGRVESGAGVFMKSNSGVEPLSVPGWNYFVDSH